MIDVCSMQALSRIHLLTITPVSHNCSCMYDSCYELITELEDVILWIGSQKCTFLTIYCLQVYRFVLQLMGLMDGYGDLDIEQLPDFAFVFVFMYKLYLPRAFITCIVCNCVCNNQILSTSRWSGWSGIGPRWCEYECPCPRFGVLLSTCKASLRRFARRSQHVDELLQHAEDLQAVRPQVPHKPHWRWEYKPVWLQSHCVQ